MHLYNTSHISDKQIIDTLDFIVSSNENLFKGVTVNDLVINPISSMFFFRASWGQYDFFTNDIYLRVPQFSVAIQFELPYSKIPTYYANTEEYLVSVLSHELYHAWQAKNGILKRGSFFNLPDIEIPAEEFQTHVLKQFRDSKQLAKAA